MCRLIERQLIEKKIQLTDIPDLDFVEHLDADQAVAEYLVVVLEENAPTLLAAALGDIARARGMSQIAEAPTLPVVPSR